MRRGKGSKVERRWFAMQNPFENQKRILVLTSRGFQDGHDSFLSLGASRSTIAAPYFAIDDSATQALLSPVVRGIDGRIEQEPEPFSNVSGEMLCKSPINEVPAPDLHKFVELQPEPQISRCQFVRRPQTLAIFIS